MSKGKPVTMSWEKFHPESRPCTSFTIKMYECEAEDAPTRLTAEVRQCETIIIPFSWSNLLVQDGADGKRFRRVQFDLKMSMLGMGKLDFATYVDGNMVARKNVSVKLGDSHGERC